MADQLAVLEKKGPDQSRNLYVVGAPAYRVESAEVIIRAPEHVRMGKVTQISRNDQHYVVGFANGHQLVLNPNKVVVYQTFTTSQAQWTYLSEQGYDFSRSKGAQPATPLGNIRLLKTIPQRYIAVDCEFGSFYAVQHQGKQIEWQLTTIDGVNFGLFQLSAIGYAGTRQLPIYFNRYVDQPEFSPEQKLQGLAATGLTLAAYQQQAQPLAVVRAFIAQVLAPGLPLMAWDYHNDYKVLRSLVKRCEPQLTKDELALLRQPIRLFDGEAYVNQVINHANKGRGKASYTLPLSGIAGLLNIATPNAHNALWDAQTVHTVMQTVQRLQNHPVTVTAPHRPPMAPATPVATPVASTQAKPQHHALARWFGPRHWRRGKRAPLRVKHQR
ncbi:hypothetical protein [Levilactobacillus suantsaii]|uniref:Uncharacterized protein n=1 Tax=Levilactobacillus suantsaii TaxID=2292255 RepID=A0A4Q0VI79_9LACO|nr:hypothetical protein [Levilactobacillus suantsaii]QMU08397.1 hypothetical protein H3M12_01590 [Levilactobacillus suantsaii]RXI77832.1 hypothetical protein DXH47_08560 [Levilactobacillus suantsaii]